MALSIPLKGEERFEVAGLKFTLVYSVAAMVALENAFEGESINDLSARLTGDLRAADLVIFVEAGLAQYHDELTRDDARQIVDGLGFAQACFHVAKAWSMAIRVERPAPGGAAARPPKGAAKGPGTGKPSTASGAS